MGAWGHGSFENDDATGWVYEFDRSGVAAVTLALEHISKLGDGEYLEAPEASAAIAAAEIVAALRDGDQSKLPDDARSALAKHQRSLSGSPILALAPRAVERILRQSELKELCDEGEEGEAWLKGMDALSSRLR